MTTKHNEKTSIFRLVSAIALSLILVFTTALPAFAVEAQPAEDTEQPAVTEGAASDDNAGISNDSGDAATPGEENGEAVAEEESGANAAIVQEEGKYYFYSDGELATDCWVKHEGKVYYASEDGSFFVDQFIKVDSKSYYVNSEGEVQTGIFTIGGKKYYGATSGDPAGAIYTGWFKEGGKRYVADATGALKLNQWVNSNGKYRTNANGQVITGNFKVGSYYYHGTLSGSNMGKVLTGTATDGGKTYVANKNGVLTRNKWIVKSSTKRYYVAGDGAYVKNKTVAIGGIPYKFRSNGTMVAQKGFGTYKGNHFYKNKKGLPVKKKLIKHSGKKYYMASNGLAVKDKWITVKGARMYFNKSGKWVKNVKNVKFDKSWKYKGKGKLTRSGGVYKGPGGKETYYNMGMSDVIATMRRMGFDSKRYPYWVRSDGVKMLGPYVIVAANFNIRPRGSVVVTSGASGAGVRHRRFVSWSPRGIDIAVTW